MDYKNLEIIPGIATTFKFDLLGDDFLKIDITGYTFKFEVLDISGKLKLVNLIPAQSGLGFISFTISEQDGAIFKDALYQYRVVIISPSQVGRLCYKGFLSVGSPYFSYGNTPVNSAVTLPDGSVYVTTDTLLVTNSWYAISTYFRFLISGLGVVVIDGKDLHGTVWINLGVFESNSFDEQRWIPSLEGMTAFRIKQVTGNNTIRYLP